MGAVPKTLGEALQRTQKILAESSKVAESAVLQESEQLIAKGLETDFAHPLKRADLYSRLSQTLENWEQIEAWAYRRAQGEPLQYILGYQVFLDHVYRVGPGVLVPRPETELVVTEVLKRLKVPKLGIEIGLGSGAISIELLSAIPDLQIYASEASPDAAAYAEMNASRILGSDRKRLHILRAQSPEDVFGAFSKMKADFLVSNPPYLASEDEMQLQVLEHEPELALFPANQDSLHFYREIARVSQEFLAEWGQVFVEIPSSRSGPIVELFQNQGWNVALIQDLTGRERMLSASR